MAAQASLPWSGTPERMNESRSLDGDRRQATGAGRALHGSGGKANAQDVLPAEPCRVRATEAAVQSADRTRRDDGKPVDGRPAGSEPADSHTKTRAERVRDLFLSRPNVWLDGRDFEAPGGRYAWRSRIADCRIKFGMVIENRQRTIRGLNGNYVVSEYRYQPK